jgi:hypothetical protein
MYLLEKVISVEFSVYCASGFADIGRCPLRPRRSHMRRSQTAVAIECDIIPALPERSCGGRARCTRSARGG